MKKRVGLSRDMLAGQERIRTVDRDGGDAKAKI